MFKILLIGSRGNMGKRYACLLNEYSPTLWDIGNAHDNVVPGLYTHALICTPLDSHKYWVDKLSGNVKNILCEKPLFDDIKDYDKYTDSVNSVKCVNNWAFLPHIITRENANEIVYNRYYHGPGTDEENLIQPVYYAYNNIIIRHDNAIGYGTIGGNLITGHHVDISYESMLANWLQGGDKLWTVRQALDAWIKVNKLKERRS